LVDEHLDGCEKAQEIISIISSKKDNSLVYDNEIILQRKGYVGEIIKQIKDWGLINKIIFTDLKKDKRIGAVNALAV